MWGIHRCFLSRFQTPLTCSQSGPIIHTKRNGNMKNPGRSPKSSRFKNGIKQTGWTFERHLAVPGAYGHDVCHLNTGVGCVWESPFPPTLPVAFPLGPGTVPVSPGTKIWNLDRICVCECVGGQMFFWRLCFGFRIPRQKMGQLQIFGGQPVSTCCRKHCVFYIKVISRQLLTCVGFLHI